MPPPGLERDNSQDQPLFWTDDIPVCPLSAVGLSNNQIYRDNAPSRREEHQCEDSSFRFRPESDNEIFLYGAFDGHGGSKVSNFAAQRFPAEILLGQLTNKLNDDEEIANVLHQAFISVDKTYLDTISDQLAEKCNLREQLSGLQDLSSAEALQLYNDTLKRIEKLDGDISGGTSAVLALIIKQKLYVANVGCCRALLCKTDSDGVLRVHQLTLDHTLHNAEEIQRLVDLGVPADRLQTDSTLHPYTRTIGDFNVKVGYKDIDLYCRASSEPVIADPELSLAIDLDADCRFLILMSSGVYRSLEDAGAPNANVTIASAVASEFAVQSTLSGVAQGVVDKIARTHHDAYVTNSDGIRREICAKREDMTLLVRNFNYPMPNSGVGSPMHATPLSVVIPTSSATTGGGPMDGVDDETEDYRPMFTVGSLQQMTNLTATNMTNRYSYTSSNESSTSWDESGRLFAKKSAVKNPLPLDSDGKIEAYVDFQGFYDAFEAMEEKKREDFLEDTEPKPAFETIPEEKEMLSPGVSSSSLQTPTGTEN